MWSGPASRPGSMRRTLSGVAAVLLGIAALGAAAVLGAQGATLHLASTPWPPFTAAPGQARFAIDLVHSALERVGVTADTTIVPEGTLTAALREGKFDGSAALWHDAERERTLLYSKPYMENRLVLVGRQGADVSATSLGALGGKRIALVDGYAYGEALSATKGPTFVPAKTVEESLEKVLAGEADYVLMDELVIQYLLRHHAAEVKTRLALGTTPMLVRTLHFAVRRDRPDAQSIVDRFDAELLRMVSDRSYHRLLQLEWIEADVDGDGRTEVVPASDRAGQAPPSRQYELLTRTDSTPPAPAPARRFYIGGQVYEGWSAVPDRYKVADPRGTPWGSTVAPVFSFKW